MVYTINSVSPDTGTQRAIKFYAASLEEAFEYFRDFCTRKKKHNRFQVQIPEPLRKKLECTSKS
jgi:hypothetical protein